MPKRGHEKTGRLRKWYCCMNEAGFEANLPLLMAASFSAQHNTDLVPHCLYSGTNPHHRNLLTRLGFTIIDHRPSLEDALRAGYGDAFDRFDGHWLRIDLPLIEQDEDYVLYTDIDVMFQSQPHVPVWPRHIAAAPEFHRAKWWYFSSGVMVLNVREMRALYPAFAAHIRHRLTNNFQYPAHDQESYNRFFGPTPLNLLRGRVRTQLPAACNWKPFWGVSETASIIHFHGPKPPTVRKFERCGPDPALATLVRLWERNKTAYDHYCTQWDDHAQRAKKHLDSFL